MTRAEIIAVKSLSDKRARTESGLFVVEGAKLTGEILASTLRVRKIYTTGDLFTESGAERISTKEMQRITSLKTASDVLAVVEIPSTALEPSRLANSLVLALDGVSNPGNLGTLIRTADWFGISDILCSEDSADCFNPKVVQATMGAITRVRVHYVELASTLSTLSAAGSPIYGTFLDGENIYEARLSAAGVIVVGSEGDGIREQVAATVSRRLFIPPYPAGRHGSESLNVAIAAAITCSEFRRR
ncbi:MAG: RNA methyltransferase [Prevotellaceae bacterium]|nr:RNA methyltransferase [Prevotellaceae bacterium]